MSHLLNYFLQLFVFVAKVFDLFIFTVFDVVGEVVFFGFESLLNMSIIEGGCVEDMGMGEACIGGDGFGFGL